MVYNLDIFSSPKKCGCNAYGPDSVNILSRAKMKFGTTGCECESEGHSFWQRLQK